MRLDSQYDKMHEYVKKIDEGEALFYHPHLQITPQKIEINVGTEEMYEGSFHLESLDRTMIYGRVISYGMRVKPLVKDFSGVSVDIPFVFDSAGMMEGDMVKGDITILSNCGEAVLHYMAVVSRESIVTSSGMKIRSLQQLSELAEADYQAAFELFSKDALGNIIKNESPDAGILYRGIKKDIRKIDKFEEFLCAAGLKEKAVLDFVEKEVYVDACEDSFTFSVSRNTWGYIKERIWPDADFIDLSHPVVTSADFETGILCIEGKIIRDRLHAGKNYSYIYIGQEHNKKRMEVTVYDSGSCGDADEYRHALRKKILIQLYEGELVKTCFNYHIKNFDEDAFLTHIRALSSKLSLLEGHNRLLLTEYNIYAYIVSGQIKEAEALLNEIGGTDFTKVLPVVYGFYLYLLAMVETDEEEIGHIAGRIHRVYLENRHEDLLLLLFLKTDTEYRNDPVKKLKMLRHQCENGGNSPFIYLEVYYIMIQNMSLLEELSEFELLMVNFACRTGLFNLELSKRIVAIAQRDGDYSYLLFKVLNYLREEYDSDEILAVLCTVLINGDRKDEEAYRFYSMAVERELRITRLFEYYMQSLPPDYAKSLPRIIQLYYEYTSELDSKRQALLYSNIILYHGDNPMMLEKYEPRMLKFALEQVKEGRISQTLSIIYTYFSNRQEFLDAASGALSVIAFCHKIRMKAFEKYPVLILVQENLEGEKRYAVKGDELYIPIYTGNYRIFLEDTEKNRIVPYDLIEDESVFQPERYTQELLNGSRDNIPLLIFLYNRLKEAGDLNEKGALILEDLIRSKEVTWDFVLAARYELMKYYLESGQEGRLEGFLSELNMESVSAKERSFAVELLINQGMDKRALEIMRKYGVERISVKYIHKLCESLAVSLNETDDNFFISLCNMVFLSNGRDMSVLSCLIRNLEGSSRTLRNLWKTAVELDMPVKILEERLLIQMIYTGAHVMEIDDIVDSYMSKGGLREIEGAYLSVNSYDYYVKNAVLENRFFDLLINRAIEGRRLNTICAIALIEYASVNRHNKTFEAAYGNQLLSCVVSYIVHFMEKGFLLPSFMEFADVSDLIAIKTGTRMALYRSEREGNVRINYLAGEDGDYICENMKMVYPGIYTRSFLQFYGDSLQYYISEKVDGRENLTGSVSMVSDEVSDDSATGKYRVINDMLMCMKSGEEESLLKLMEVYSHKNYVTSKIFRFR